MSTILSTDVVPSTSDQLAVAAMYGEVRSGRVNGDAHVRITPERSRSTTGIAG